MDDMAVDIQADISGYAEIVINLAADNNIDINLIDSDTDVYVNMAVEQVDITVELVAGETLLPVASADTLGGIKIGNNLKIENGVLSVDTATQVEQDNTKPVTSGAVHTELGNIEALLAGL
jgi:hypothetical protein